MAVVVLQGNLNRSRVAQDLLSRICLEGGANLVLISEPYRGGDGPGRYSDALGTAAIWIPDVRRFAVASHGSGSGFVWVRSGDVTYVSCYLTPNERIAEYQAKLDGLEDAVRGMEGELVVAGDFNAKALEWGEARTDSRGGRLMDLASRTGLVILNTGSATTFRRPGYRETIIDVSLATERLASRVEGWGVIEDYTASDHQYVAFRVRDVVPARAHRHQGPARWSVDKMNIKKLSPALGRGQRALSGIPENLPPVERADRIVDSVMSHVHRACREAVPRSSPGGARRPVYWWTDEIAELRRACLRLRRLAQRARFRDPDAARRAEAHLRAKRELRRAIKLSKLRCWRRLTEDLNEDP